jgi:hypothetical protein
LAIAFHGKFIIIISRVACTTAIKTECFTAVLLENFTLFAEKPFAFATVTLIRRRAAPTVFTIPLCFTGFILFLAQFTVSIARAFTKHRGTGGITDFTLATIQCALKTARVITTDTIVSFVTLARICCSVADTMPVALVLCVAIEATIIPKIIGCTLARHSFAICTNRTRPMSCAGFLIIAFAFVSYPICIAYTRIIARKTPRRVAPAMTTAIAINAFERAQRAAPSNRAFAGVSVLFTRLSIQGARVCTTAVILTFSPTKTKGSTRLGAILLRCRDKPAFITLFFARFNAEFNVSGSIFAKYSAIG